MTFQSKGREQGKYYRRRDEVKQLTIFISLIDVHYSGTTTRACEGTQCHIVVGIGTESLQNEANIIGTQTSVRGRDIAGQHPKWDGNRQSGVV